jgi:GNAT superfamily N-acetyltransferase
MPAIIAIETDDQIYACFQALLALRPQLSAATLLERVRRQYAQGYRLTAIQAAGEIPALAGWRMLEFLAWGRVLYIDDLSTLPQSRGLGYGGMLLDWLIEHARAAGCDGVHLDTGYQRHAAHRLYLAKGFVFDCHHCALPLAAG